ncbi:MAG TPA: cupin domain-containing protein [Thermoanaerobaculia bacterium]
MKIRGLSFWLATSMASCVALTGQASAQQAMSQPMGHNTADMKLVTMPGLPTCAQASVMSGDPSKGPSTLYAKVASGCSIPWHWHTPNEQLMIASGTAVVDVKDGSSITLKPGGFAMMPSRHVHQFKCQAGACAFYIVSDGVFDIHYVDAQGAELSPADALKAVKETAATQMK